LLRPVGLLGKRKHDRIQIRCDDLGLGHGLVERAGNDAGARRCLENSAGPHEGCAVSDDLRPRPE
jgi:hypothetical protein